MVCLVKSEKQILVRSPPSLVNSTLHQSAPGWSPQRAPPRDEWRLGWGDGWSLRAAAGLRLLRLVIIFWGTLW